MREFNKSHRSIAEQIEKLKQCGMEFPGRDEQRAAHYLSHLNYYRLSGYWYPFLDPQTRNSSTKKFLPSTTFGTVLEHYIFDRELRLLVMDAIERIEVSVRTQWAYHLSKAHGAHAFMDCKLFRRTFNHGSFLKSIQNEFNRSKEPFIKHYKNTYNTPSLPPIWAVCEIMSLGQLSYWYANIKEQFLRQSIADKYMMDEKILVSLLQMLSLIRNICAHHSRLWNRRFTKTAKLPKRKPGDLYCCFNHEQDAIKKLYNSLVLIAYMMNIINPGHHWRQRLIKLLKKHPDINEASMGFLNGWLDMDFWNAAAT